MLRKCSKCGLKKELSTKNFGKKRTGKLGFDSQCKDCKRKRDQKRYQKNRERILEEKATYYRENKDARKEYQHDYYHENKEKCLQSGKNWQQNNPTRRRMTCAKSRTMQYGAESTLTEKQWLQVKALFHNSCAYCGMTEKEHLEKYGEFLHQEHVVPLAMHGPYSIGNVVPACRSCNSSKANHDFFEWYPKSKGYSREREKQIVDYIDQ